MALNELRKKIDQIDTKIVALLNDRARAAMAIGQHKIKNRKGIYASDRESLVLRKIKSLNQGPMKDAALEAIYREITSSSLSLEKPLQIAYLGPKATFANLAAIKKFGSQLDYVSCVNISEVFHMVERDECDYGVVPIENSIEGAVTHTFDLLVESDLKICSQVMLDISHNLLSNVTKDKIRAVYSHPQVFGQCRHWIEHHLPHADLVEVTSTTAAAQIASERKNTACIASELAAKEYKLNVLKRGIQDNPHNITRFLILSKQDVSATGQDRTSIVFSIRDKVGALHDMLEPFYKNKINLTKIESRPLKKKAWDYYFFVDFQGHRDDPKVQKALASLDDMCKFLKVLGSYPVLDEKALQSKHS